MEYRKLSFGNLKNRIIKIVGNYRNEEYKKALIFFKEYDRVIDVGCGAGGFLELLVKNGKKEVFGFDLNPDLVNICKSKKLNVVLGDALSIPFKDDTFNGAYCSHVMHVFGPRQAFNLMKELIRVVKSNGIIAITTVPFYERFFLDPADMRPYPPESIRGMFQRPKADTCGAPTLRGLPALEEIGIWLRRPALFDLNFQGNHRLFLVCQFLNQLQYRIYFRKYWSFNGYIIVFRNTKEKCGAA
jgi:SAM-dependent methyltransferase